jgi:hypothetical protein
MGMKCCLHKLIDDFKDNNCFIVVIGRDVVPWVHVGQVKGIESMFLKVNFDLINDKAMHCPHIVCEHDKEGKDVIKFLN